MQAEVLSVKKLPPVADSCHTKSKKCPEKPAQCIKPPQAIAINRFNLDVPGLHAKGLLVSNPEKTVE